MHLFCTSDAYESYACEWSQCCCVLFQFVVWSIVLFCTLLPNFPLLTSIAMLVVYILNVITRQVWEPVICSDLHCLAVGDFAHSTFMTSCPVRLCVAMPHVGGCLDSLLFYATTCPAYFREHSWRVEVKH